MALAFGAVLAVAAMLAVLWPPTYLAAGTLRVELPTAASEVTSPAAAQPRGQRWQDISRRVLAPADLLEIARRHGLYGAERDTLGREALAERLLADIRLDPVDVRDVKARRPGRPPATATFSIGFESRSPDVAVRVANDLVGLYLRDSRPREPTSTVAPTAAEIRALQERVTELEQGIAQLREGNADRSADSAPDDAQEVERLRQDLRNLEGRMRTLDRQLAGSDPRLEEARSWLAMDRERYPPDHPSVRQLEQEVAGLEQQLEAQRRAAREERATLVAQRRELQARLERLQQAQRATQATEQESTALARELEVAQNRLAEARQRAAAAARPAERSARTDGARFTLLEPPQRPRAPIRPNRALILAIGFIAAVVTALALMLLLEARDPRVRGPRAVATVLGEAPLVVVPWFADTRGTA